VSLQSENLKNHYTTNFALMQHHKYSLTELDNMIPWEREIYVNLLSNYLKEEREKMEAKKKTKR
jgi:hypothetical protein